MPHDDQRSHRQWISPPDVWDAGWQDQPPWFPLALPVNEQDPVLIALLQATLGSIEKRRSDILQRRLGLTDEGRQTLAAIGDEYGVTRERVRQLQENGLKRLRARRGRAIRTPGSPEGQLAKHLSTRFRSLRRIDRGRLLIATFPEGPSSLIARVLAACGGFDEPILTDWIEYAEAEHDRQRATEMQAARGERLRARFLDAVVWPEAKAPPQWTRPRPLRDVRDEGRRFLSQKAGREVACESQLEERVMRFLEDAAFVREYCEQPVRIRYRWFDGDHWYYPDVAVRLDDNRCVLVEVKPATQWADGRNLAKWNAATRWCADRGWGFAVMEDSRFPQALLSAASLEAKSLLAEITADGEADWHTLQARWFSAGYTHSSLVTNSLAYGFAILRSPLRVRPARSSPWLQEVQRAPVR